MLTFCVAFRAAGGAQMRPLAPGARGPVASPGALAVPAQLDVLASPNSRPVLNVSLDPATLTVTAAIVDGAALHYFRLADATVKPLPPTPPPLPCRAGDAYIAVTSAAAQLAKAAPGGASAAIARFLHLRDDFNAEKLAGALLAHVLELGADADAAGVGVLVVEVR